MHGSFGFFAIRKIKILQKFFHILRLMNICSIRSLIDLNPKEVLEFSHHAHLELSLHRLSKLLTTDAKGFCIVNPFLLTIALSNQFGFISYNFSFFAQLDSEDPLGSNDVESFWSRNNIPYVIPCKLI